MTRLPTDQAAPAWFRDAVRAGLPVAAPAAPSMATAPTAPVAAAPSVRSFDEFKQAMQSSANPAETFGQLMDAAWSQKSPEWKANAYSQWVQEAAAHDAESGAPAKDILDKRAKEAAVAFPDMQFNPKQYHRIVKGSPPLMADTAITIMRQIQNKYGGKTEIPDAGDAEMLRAAYATYQNEKKEVVADTSDLDKWLASVRAAVPEPIEDSKWVSGPFGTTAKHVRKGNRITVDTVEKGLMYAAQDHEKRMERVARYLGSRLPFGEAIQAAQLLDLRDSIHKISSQQATDQDYIRVGDYLYTAQQNAKAGWARRVFDVASMLPGYAVSFGLTGGAYTAAKEATAGVAAKAMGAAAAKTIGGKVVQAVVPRAMGVAAQAAANPQMVAANFAQQWLPKFELTQDAKTAASQLVIRDDPEFIEALAKGFGSAAIEIGSERGGKVLEWMGPLAAKVPGAARVAALKSVIVARVMGKAGTAAGEKLAALMKKGGWNGVVGEMLEERMGEAARGATGIEPNYGTTGKLFTDPKEALLHDLSVEAAAFLLPVAGQAAANRLSVAPPAASLPIAVPTQPPPPAPSPAAVAPTVPPTDAVSNLQPVAGKAVAAKEEGTSEASAEDVPVAETDLEVRPGVFRTYDKSTIPPDAPMVNETRIKGERPYWDYRLPEAAGAEAAPATPPGKTVAEEAIEAGEYEPTAAEVEARGIGPDGEELKAPAVTEQYIAAFGGTENDAPGRTPMLRRLLIREHGAQAPTTPPDATEAGKAPAAKEEPGTPRESAGEAAAPVKPYADRVAVLRDVAFTVARSRGAQQADADDIAQNVWMSFAGKEAEYGSFSDDQLRNFAAKAAKNAVKSIGRKKAQEQPLEAVAEPAAQPEMAQPEPVSLEQLRHETDDDLAARWTALGIKGKPPGDHETLTQRVWSKLPPELRVEKGLSKQAEQPIAPPTEQPSVGMQASGQIRTLAGREIAPPAQKPRKGRGVSRNVLAVDTWLVQEAMAEAKSKGDEWNADNFGRIDPKRITPAERDGLNLYLFGQEEISLLPTAEPPPTIGKQEESAPGDVSAPVAQAGKKSVGDKPAVAEPAPKTALPKQKPAGEVAPAREAPVAEQEAKTAPPADWKPAALAAVKGKVRSADAMTLPDLLAKVRETHPAVTEEEFKRGLIEMYRADQLKLEEYTSAWADVFDNPLAIKESVPGKTKYDEKDEYGLLWWVRDVEGKAAPDAEATGAEPQPVARTTPRTGTAEREALEKESDESMAARDATSAAVDKTKAEIERTGYGTKKRETLSKRLEKQREADRAAWARYEKAREVWYQAQVEDAAEQSDNVPLQLAARWKLGEQGSEQRDAVFEQIQEAIRPLLGEAVTAEKDGAGRLSEADDKEAIEHVLRTVAGDVMNAPLQAKDIVDRVRGRLRAERLDVYRSNKIQELQALGIDEYGSMREKYDFDSIDTVFEKAKKEYADTQKAIKAEEIAAEQRIQRVVDALLALATKNQGRGVTGEQAGDAVTVAGAEERGYGIGAKMDKAGRQALKRLKDSGQVVIVETAKGKKLYLPEYVPAKSVARKKATAAPEPPIPPAGKAEGEAKKPAARQKGVHGGPAATVPTSTPAGGATLSTGEIVSNISQDFEVPVRTGHFRGGPERAGIYKDLEQVARIKGYGDIAVAAHEVAHHVDNTTNVLSNVPAAAQAELAALDYQPGRGDIHEGFAEYVRHRLTTDDAAVLAPAFDAWFTNWLNAHQGLSAAFTHSRSVVDKWRQAGAVERVRAQVHMGESAWTRIAHAANPKTVWDWIANNWINRLRPLLNVAKEMVGAKSNASLVNAMPSDVNFWAFAKISNIAAAAKVRGWVFHGASDVAGNRVGAGLQEVFKPIAAQLRNKDRMLDFYAYAYARHAVTLYDQYQDALNQWIANGQVGSPPTLKQPGISRLDAEETIAAFDATPGWRAASDGLTAWHGHLIDYLVDAGGLSQEAANAMKAMYPNYISLARHMDSEFAKGAGGGGGRFANLPQAVQRLKGSGRQIMPPLESALAYAERIIGLADKIRVSRMLIEASTKYGTLGDTVEKVDPKSVPHSARLGALQRQLEDAGADLSNADMDALLTTFSQEFTGDAKDNIVVLYEHGEPQMYYVRPDLYRALMALDKPAALPWIINNTFGRVARTIRLGTTGLKPGFSLLTNPLRDMQTAMVQTEYQPRNPFSIAVNTAMGLWEDVSGGEIAQIWERGGGPMAQPLGIDRKFLQETIQELLATSPKAMMLNWMRHPIDSLRTLFSVPEAAPRLAEARAALYKSGWRPGQAVTFEQYVRMQLSAANVTTDFREGGSIAMWVNQLVPFFNVAIQGPHRMASAIRNHPVSTISSALIWLTLPSLLLWWKYKDEDWWKNLTASERARYWHMPIPGTDTILRIPKPFEWGHIFASMPEAAAQSMYEKDPEAVKEAMGVMMDDMSPSILPGLVEAPVEIAANRDFYFDRPLVPERLQALEPGDQYNPYTTAAAKAIGKLLGVSPIYVEHLASGWTGGLATQAAGAVESLVGKTGHKTQREVTGGASTLPVVGRLFMSPLHTRVMDDFYTRLERLEQKHASLKLRNQSDPSIVVLRFMQRRSEELADLRKQSRAVLADESVTDDQKRERFISLHTQMVKLAQEAKQIHGAAAGTSTGDLAEKWKEIQKREVSRIVQDGVAPDPVRKNFESDKTYQQAILERQYNAVILQSVMPQLTYEGAISALRKYWADNKKPIYDERTQEPKAGWSQRVHKLQRIYAGQERKPPIDVKSILRK